MTAPDEYFTLRRSNVGTHWDDCYKSHPDCAYWLGSRDGWQTCAQEIERRIVTEIPNEYYEAIVREVGARGPGPNCGDYPAPCNCDDPVTHGGH